MLAPLLTVHRPRWRSYLLLSRVSNLPTVWTNVLAGMCASSPSLDSATYLRVAAAVSLFYTGGMFLNDAFDEPFDRRSRPERPIPAGDVSRSEVFVVGSVLLGVGELLLAPRLLPLVLGVALAVAIVLYDYQHKGNSVAPLIMGSCRGLVYGVAAAAWGGLTAAVVAGAVVMVSYVAALTVVAKLAGARARWLVPVLIAGISIVDAVFIAIVTSSGALALVAACGFGLTLFLQRFVPGAMLGKLATATFILTSVVIMYFNYRREQSIVIDIVVWLSLTLTVVSAADYFMKLRKLVN